MAVLIMPNGSRLEVAPLLSTNKFKLEDLQHLVGGYLEKLDLNRALLLDNGLPGDLDYILVDEDGATKGGKPNWDATKLWSHPGPLPLVGPALLVTAAELD